MTVHDDDIAVDDDLEVAGEREDRNRNCCCWICDGMNKIVRALKVLVMASRWDIRTARRRRARWETQVNGLQGRERKQTKMYLARLSTERSSPMVDGI